MRADHPCSITIVGSCFIFVCLTVSQLPKLAPCTGSSCKSGVEPIVAGVVLFASQSLCLLQPLRLKYAFQLSQSIGLRRRSNDDWPVYSPCHGTPHISCSYAPEDQTRSGVSGRRGVAKLLLSLAQVGFKLLFCRVATRLFLPVLQP